MVEHILCSDASHITKSVPLAKHPDGTNQKSPERCCLPTQYLVGKVCAMRDFLGTGVEGYSFLFHE